MGTKGASQGTTTSTSTPAGPAMQSYRALMQRANQYSQTPYQAYGGELVAGVNPEEMQGIGGINQYANSAQPLITEAEGLARSAATPLTSADIQQYMDPYTGQVISATEADFANTNAQQMQGVKGNAIAQGALGGNREAVAEAETAAQQQRAEAPILANLRNQGYQTALNTAMQEKAAQGQGAYSLGNLGVSGQNAGLTGANAMIGAGGLEQSTQQALDQALYGQFMQKMGYTPQMLSWLAGITTGVGSQMGGTSSTTGPPPNPWAQIAGLGALGLGAIGGGKARGGAVNREVGGGVDSLLDMARKVSLVTQALQGAHRGGGIAPRGYAEGGAPWDASEWIPDEQMTKGSGAPKPPAAPGQTGAGGGGGLSGLMGLGQAAGNVLGSVGGSVATGLGEVMPESMASVAEFLPFLALHRGGVAGYDDGGGVANRFDGPAPWAGGKSWIPGMNIVHGPGAPKAPNAPKDTNPLSDMKTMSALGKGVSGAYDSFQKSSAGDAVNDAIDEAFGERRGGRVRGYDDGGDVVDDVSPTDPDYGRAVFPPPSGVIGDDSGDFGPSWGKPAQMIGHGATLGDMGPGTDFEFNPTRTNANRAYQAPDLPEPIMVADRSEGVAPRRMAYSGDGGADVTLASYDGARPGRRASEDEPPRPPRDVGPAPAPAAEHRGFGLGLFSPNVSNALMTAGLGMMASRSPYFLSGVGEGGLAGMQAYQTGEHQSKQEALKQKEIDMRAAKLAQQLDLEERKFNQPKLTTDERGAPILVNPHTGKAVSVEAVTPGQRPVQQMTPPPPPTPATEKKPIEVKDEELPVHSIMVQDEQNPTVPSWVHEEALEGMEPKDAALVRRISDGRQKFLPLTRNNKYNQYIMGKVGEYDPQADETLFGRRQRTMNFFAVGTQGGGGQNLAAVNTWAQHAAALRDLIEKLDNGGYPTLNHIKNWAADQGLTDSERQKLLGALDTNIKAVADEGAKIFAGSGSALADRKAWAEDFGRDKPLSVMKEKLAQVAHLVDGRVNSMTYQYNEGTRTNHRAADFLAPQTRERMEVLRGEREPAPRQRAAAPPGTPPASAADALAQARAAIAAGKPRDLVIQRLREHGIDPTGL